MCYDSSEARRLHFQDFDNNNNFQVVKMYVHKVALHMKY